MERKDMKLGFIGFGNMAQAIAEGLLLQRHWSRSRSAPVRRIGTSCAPQRSPGACAPAGRREVAEAADVVIVAVKPHLIEEVLSPVRGQLADKAVVSVAAGWPFERTRRCCPERAI
jgi:pyrroline-5-carboxylate reductase